MTQLTPNHIHQLRDQVSHSEYRVDSRAVADAIVRRRWAVAIRPKPAQTRVSVIAQSRLDAGIQALAA